MSELLSGVGTGAHHFPPPGTWHHQQPAISHGLSSPSICASDGLVQAIKGARWSPQKPPHLGSGISPPSKRPRFPGPACETTRFEVAQGGPRYPLPDALEVRVHFVRLTSIKCCAALLDEGIHSQHQVEGGGALWLRNGCGRLRDDGKASRKKARGEIGPDLVQRACSAPESAFFQFGNDRERKGGS